MNDAINQISLIEETDAHIEEIKSGLITAIKVPLITGRDEFNNPDEIYGVYRKQGGDSLGTVGKDFRPANLSNFLDVIRDSVYSCCGDVIDLRKMSYHEHYGGKKVNFHLPIKDLLIGPKKVGDITKIAMNFWTGFDGKTKFTSSLQSYRIFCENGCGVWDNHIALNFKNTKHAEAKVSLFTEEIIAQLDAISNYEQFLNSCYSKKVTNKEVKEFINNSFGYEDYTEETPAKKLKALELFEAIQVEAEHNDLTVYSLLQGATRYTTHNMANNDSDILLKPSIRNLNAKAHDLALELLN